ncbi:hypothetical protein KAFR_0K01450 [Kazachstania africana CBS 2517]|uniref:Translation initiation factor eIF2B subunit delta n=1 Tax=Kazachstania africana (strain ATCC 22294 / BCRC 22015 / CBS 2517 / CECT 1963 / NBRC 1671 / NRRL Y-8276) TaxID=1071382 RepID=H2B1J9_KAZAF|nr:hypothetical protein KAFR_0K01450 [Kazachstania africana CBS 2517]CCF60499.1 hypothetical protein KAFR_0K01450 [Kazachstania africana CBS 2517]
MSSTEKSDTNIEPQESPSSTTPGSIDEKKLSNKELKELKKQQKAAKRAAQKQASGISIEQQQAQAQAKREKKQQQREQQQREQQKKEAKKNKLNVKQNTKKSSLFSHLETTDERRASILALSSAVNSPKTSRTTAAGLMVPMIASALSGSQVYTTSSFASALSKHPSTTAAATASHPGSISSTSDIAKSLAQVSLESDDFSVLPGVSSIIPHALQTSFDTPQLLSSVKELLSNKDSIHPAIALLTSNIANYKIVGSIPRCIAMLEAFQIVIRDYETPKGTTLSRNLTNYLSHQIDILKKARPLSVTMGNAIRWLKQEISHIDPSTSDAVAKEDLCEQIAQFAREKIELADKLIIDNASIHIEDSTTIVTYGSSKVLTDLILYNAITCKKNIKVIVVDSRPLFEGRKTADFLRKKGVNVVYALITSLDAIFNMDVDYLFLGAHSILSNGFLYSRAGTAMLAMSANRRNIPVLVCCESLKFSQRVQLDSVTFNELADPNDLVSIDHKDPMEKRGNTGGLLLQQFVKEREDTRKKQESENALKGKSGSNNKKAISNDSKPNNEDKDKEDTNILDKWQDWPSLNIVNILYDLTPPEYIKKVITEFGALPPSSVPVILREYKGSA